MGWGSVTRLVEVEQPAEEAAEVNAGADGGTAIFPSSVQLVHERPGGCRSVRPDDGGLVSESFSGKAKTLRRPGSVMVVAVENFSPTNPKWLAVSRSGIRLPYRFQLTSFGSHVSFTWTV